jgi:hypothetical protein
MDARTAAFLVPDVQKRIDAMLAATDALPDAAILRLAGAPPTTAADVESAVAARDPTSSYKTNAAAARAITKMRLTLIQRDSATLDKWQQAIEAAAQ